MKKQEDRVNSQNSATLKCLNSTTNKLALNCTGAMPIVASKMEKSEEIVVLVGIINRL